MKKKWIFLITGFFAMLLLAGCGAKTQEDVLKDLQSKVEDLKGYKLTAKMTLTMGTEPQTYDVDVWYNKPDFYRVQLKNGGKQEQSQLILRNKDGVYVLTPALKKSFKFQSDWPKNGSQPYLYESLVADLANDKEAIMKDSKEHYVFETKTRYQYNKMMPIQEITFNKKDLSPISLKIMDQDRNTMLAVEFSKMQFNAEFDNSSFDLDRNMTSAKIEIPVTSNNGDENFTVKIPAAEIPGTDLVGEKEVMTANGSRYVLTYEGEKSFTLMQEKVEVIETSSFASTTMNGDPVDLGFTIGALTDHSLTWTYDGVEYMIASKDLTKEEMVMLARSVQATEEK
ncbi:LolA family protein [Bacillus kwashiorkori]|uniref:LolA family protein n=1 Tax=Bacillus kwashiorkori TaxID=1522318 RepID=UPI0007867B77|nr:outer membrane lipoprotein carrier protein LolA [Bacillus kwashiorkori]